MRQLLLFGVVLVWASQSSFAVMQIFKQPQNQIVWSGGQASFTVVARGAKKITYQWQKDGVNLPKQTKSTLRIGKTTPNDRGVYTVRVSDGLGTLTSKQGYLLSMGSYIQESENFNDPSSTKGLLVGGEYGDLYPEISSGKLSFKYSSGISDQDNEGDDCFWFWNQSPQRKQSFDVRIDGNDSTSGKLQLIAACLPSGLGYRIERSGREGNFNAGSGGDGGKAIKREYYITSSTQFSFRLVYDAVSKELKAYYDEDGPLNGENWTLLQKVRNPNFITGRPILIGVCYNNNESSDSLDGNNVTADNFQAR